jgi:putative addiction module component (TIGR02574 family)
MNPSSLSQIEQAALQLPEAERAGLAARLIESLDPAMDDDAEAAWGEEIQKRIEEIDQGKVPMISWEDARRMILEGRHRGPSA